MLDAHNVAAAVWPTVSSQQSRTALGLNTLGQLSARPICQSGNKFLLYWGEQLWPTTTRRSLTTAANRFSVLQNSPGLRSNPNPNLACLALKEKRGKLGVLVCLIDF